MESASDPFELEEVGCWSTTFDVVRDLLRSRGIRWRRFWSRQRPTIRAEGYVHKYAQGALGSAATFGEWLRAHRIPLDRITDQHLDGFLNWFRAIITRDVDKQEKASPCGNSFCIDVDTCQILSGAAVESGPSRSPSLPRAPAPQSWVGGGYAGVPSATFRAVLDVLLQAEERRLCHHYACAHSCIR